MCKIIQLFECRYLSMKESVRGIYFSSWNRLPPSAVIPILWATDPGGSHEAVEKVR